MRVGVFTPLLSQLPLEDVLKKLKSLAASTPWSWARAIIRATRIASFRCSKNKTELNEFKKKLDDHGFSISALSCHGNPLHPERGARQARCGSQPQDHSAGREAGRAGGDRFQRLPGRFAEFEMAQLGDLPVAAGLSRNSEVAVGRSGDALLDRSTASSPPITA